MHAWSLMSIPLHDLASIIGRSAGLHCGHHGAGIIAPTSFRWLEKSACAAISAIAWRRIDLCRGMMGAAQRLDPTQGLCTEFTRFVLTLILVFMGCALWALPLHGALHTCMAPPSYCAWRIASMPGVVAVKMSSRPTSGQCN